MPGHPIPPAPANLAEQARSDVKKLEALIDEHDVVFLLMDSRESRWLPTMLGKAKNKVSISPQPDAEHPTVPMYHDPLSSNCSL